jgi:hypothetical protein
MRRAISVVVMLALAGSAACSSSDGGTSNASGGGAGKSIGGSASSTGGATSGGATSAGGTTGVAATSKGWLYTIGNQIYVSNGTAAGTPWMGRGVNIDDMFFCGYNNSLWMTAADQTLKTVVTGLMSAWKPNFVRISLSMDSYVTVTSWLTDDAQYKTPMTGVIDAIGANPNTYVLVTLRSDASMIEQDKDAGDAEATGVPSDSTNTPDTKAFPTGTDAVYVALVDSFAHDNFVLFGLTNEPGGNELPADKISAAMSHAVSTIRAEEDKLGVPHHLVSVQGFGWSGDISVYGKQPLPQDNVVYEVHGYPPSTGSYTYANIPVIIGEYGSLSDATGFYKDVEAKEIPNLAWDFDAFSNCSPDLLEITTDATKLNPTDWGMTVQTYLTTAHATP